MPPGILGEPMNVAPHGTRHQAKNYSTPTEAAVHMNPHAPVGTGISPLVAAVMDQKIPPAFADRIRANVARKK